MLLPFETNTKKGSGPAERLVLAGDVGATKTDLALYKWQGDSPVILREERYKSADHPGMTGLLGEFQKGSSRPDAICLGVAGPVLDGHVKLSNLGWDIDSREISARFGLQQVDMINDLEATAYGLAMLEEGDIAVVHAGDSGVPGNAAIISPGTGLGEAGLYRDSQSYHPFATEGGHCDFAPRDETDIELYLFLRREFGHVSWERLVCGPGIMNIYRFLRDTGKCEEPGWLKDEYAGADAAAVISRHVHDAEICRETMRLFIRYLAFESANLVLKFKATGGLFVGGGIVPQILPLFWDNAFYSSFCQSGRLNYLLERVPVKIILNAKTALMGAAFYGNHH